MSANGSCQLALYSTFVVVADEAIFLLHPRFDRSDPPLYILTVHDSTKKNAKKFDANRRNIPTNERTRAWGSYVIQPRVHEYVTERQSATTEGVRVNIRFVSFRFVSIRDTVVNAHALFVLESNIRLHSSSTAKFFV